MAISTCIYTADMRRSTLLGTHSKLVSPDRGPPHGGRRGPSLLQYEYSKQACKYTPHLVSLAISIYVGVASCDMVPHMLKNEYQLLKDKSTMLSPES